MKAIEFKSKIKNNQIQIPKKAQSEFKTNKDKDVRVIVLIDDAEINDNIVFQESARDQFLKGYADSDSVYDNY
jgi:hypothetical protein